MMRTVLENDTPAAHGHSRHVLKELHRRRRAAKDDPVQYEKVRLAIEQIHNDVPEPLKIRQRRLVNRVRIQAGREG